MKKSLMIVAAGVMAAMLGACSAVDTPVKPASTSTELSGQMSSRALYNKAMRARYSGKFEECFALMHQAAEKDNAFAQDELAKMYEEGVGTKRDIKEAAKWYIRSADNGFIYAQFHLANMYSIGAGVEKSSEKALEWYRKAAEQGHSGAQNNIGVMYESGNGVEKNAEEAIKWFKLACDNGYDAGCKNHKLMTEPKKTEQ